MQLSESRERLSKSRETPRKCIKVPQTFYQVFLLLLLLLRLRSFTSSYPQDYIGAEKKNQEYTTGFGFHRCTICLFPFFPFLAAL